jgi:hypothetical protein
MSLICSDSALTALHRVLVCAQAQAYDDLSPELMGEAMNVTEYLVSILPSRFGKSFRWLSWLDDGIR